MAAISRRPAVLVLRMRDVLTMDSTGRHALGDLVRRTRRDGTVVPLAEVRSQPLMAMGRSGLLDEIGEDNLCGSVAQALARAREKVGG